MFRAVGFVDVKGFSCKVRVYHPLVQSNSAKEYLANQFFVMGQLGVIF